MDWWKICRRAPSLAVLTWAVGSAAGQTSQHVAGERVEIHRTLRVYLDCATGLVCDTDYLHTTLSYIAFVRDLSEADIDVLLTGEATGAGGLVTTARFIGHYAFNGLNDTLKVATARGATDDETRRAVAHLLSIGLVRFAARTSLGSGLSVTYAPPTIPSGGPNTDRDSWNAWVFSLSGAAQLSGQQYSQSGQITGSVTADRVTPAWKLDFAFSENYTYNVIHEDSVSATTIQRSLGLSGQIAKSVSDHWSAGLVTLALASPYNNERLAVHAAPALEYDVFPYTESTHHQLIFLYAIGGTTFRYLDRTIFNRLSETRADQTLTTAFGVTEPWGGASASLQAAAFLNNFRQNRQVLSADFHIRLFGGLSFTVDPSYSAIHDQIYLPAASASLDDILLARRQLATNYQYSMSVGLSFTFGSIFNSVVNPRFARVIMAGS
jgi:hypothetical protein